MSTTTVSAPQLRKDLMYWTRAAWKDCDVTLIDTARRTLIEAALDEAEGHQGKAADILGISARMMSYWLKKYRKMWRDKG